MPAERQERRKTKIISLFVKCGEYMNKNPLCKYENEKCKRGVTENEPLKRVPCPFDTRRERERGYCIYNKKKTTQTVYTHYTPRGDLRVCVSPFRAHVSALEHILGIRLFSSERETLNNTGECTHQSRGGGLNSLFQLKITLSFSLTTLAPIHIGQSGFFSKPTAAAVESALDAYLWKFKQRTPFALR